MWNRLDNINNAIGKCNAAPCMWYVCSVSCKYFACGYISTFIYCFCFRFKSLCCSKRAL